jgi:hypothetical protein
MRICLTMVLFPDSPAPVGSRKTHRASGLKGQEKPGELKFEVREEFIA